MSKVIKYSKTDGDIKKIAKISENRYQISEKIGK